MQYRYAEFFIIPEMQVIKWLCMSGYDFDWGLLYYRHENAIHFWGTKKNISPAKIMVMLFKTASNTMEVNQK